MQHCNGYCDVRRCRHFVSGDGSVSSPPSDATRGLLFAPAPEYPTEANSRRVEDTGIFLLRVQIKSGRVAQVIVGGSTRSRLLDAAAVKALLQ